MLDPSSRVAVVLASAGRPALLADAVRGCLAQAEVAFRGVVSVPDEASLPPDAEMLEGWDIVAGTRGLAAQRNAALNHLAGAADIIFFFDDDAVVRSDYLARAIAHFANDRHLVGMTGRVLADGKISGEISAEAAESILKSSWSIKPSENWKATRELYGANFAIRIAAAPGIRFDDELPLYSWLEDHDFARRLMRYGPLGRSEDCIIVHRAASSGGRTSHTRLGYSQVANPIYLGRTGSFPLWLVAQQFLRPVLKNLGKSALGSESKWRRRRLRGNLRAINDLLTKRLHPRRAINIPGEAPMEG